MSLNISFSPKTSSLHLFGTTNIEKISDGVSKNVIFTVTGPSGVGKDAIVNEVLKDKRLVKPVSFTTREPRDGEVEGVDYYFTNKKNVFEMEKRGEVFEYTDNRGNLYGYTYQELERVFATGKTPICVVDEFGMNMISASEKGKDTFRIFITPPSALELRRRLISRDGRFKGRKNIDGLVKRSETFERFAEGSKWLKKAMNGGTGMDCMLTNVSLPDSIILTKALISGVLNGNFKI